MKRFLLSCLFILGLGLALFHFPGLASQGEFDSLIVDFRDDLAPAEVSQQLDRLQINFQQAPRLNSIFSEADRVYLVAGDAKRLKALRRSPLKALTEFIEPNYIYHALEVPNDPDYVKQWNLRSIGVETAWDDSKGEGTTVAVIDTGIARVPDLMATQFVAGYDFVSDDEDATDDNGHGTHVAGTIAQSTNNGFGVAGIAYKASLMPLKVLSSSGSGTVSDIAEAIRFAAEHGADVINLSLGGGGSSELLQEAIAYAHGKGAVIVAAAGNANRNAADYPARYPHVIGVAATDAAGLKAPYSNFGAGIDIAAPGGSNTGKILQNTLDPATGEAIFAEFQGTSMAAPHVAGVAALIKSAGITDPQAVGRVLLESVNRVAEDPLNHYGAGQLNAEKAVQVAIKGKITFRDFFRWLRENGYLSPGFWLDGGAVALLPKLAMVIVSYLIAWFLRTYLPIWSWTLGGGIVFGSSGLFVLQGLYIFDLPQWPFRLLGSSIPELGNTVTATAQLNPLFASVLIPFLLVALLLGHPRWKWLAIGSAIGVAGCLMVSAVVAPSVWGLGETVSRIYLLANGLLCVGLAYLASKPDVARSNAI